MSTAIKYALCCAMSALPKAYQHATMPVVLPIPMTFWNVKNELFDRAVCETDESVQQFLPYVTVVNEDNKIFTYSRGKGGAEARLHGQLSIGLGGHVDDVPEPGVSLKTWLSVEGERELREEVGITALSPLEFKGFLRDPTTDVGRVHMGLYAIYTVTSDALGEHEEGQIEEGAWLSLDELRERETYARLEPWSKLVLSQL